MSDSSVITPEEMILEIQDISDHALTNKSTLGKIVEVLNDRGYVFKGENFEKILNIINDNYVVKYDEKNIDGFDTNGFFSSPASTKYHGAYDGGLFDHSLEVYRCALKLAKAFDMDDINKISFEACMFHDLCKVGLYEKRSIHNIPKDSFPKEYAYADNYIALPHGSESVVRIRTLGIRIPRRWEIAVAYHMGAFEADNARTYGNYCERIPDLLLLHTADMMASKISGK